MGEGEGRPGSAGALRWRLLLSLGIATTLLSGLALPCRKAAAQGEGQEVSVRWVIIESIKPVEEKGRWKLKVTGKAPPVPVGAKIEFELLWRSQVTKTFPVTLAGSHRFTEEFGVGKLVPSPDKYLFRTVIRRDKQSGAVKRQIDRDPETFPINLQPWTEYHFEKRFQIGSKEDVEKELKGIRAFFVGRYKRLSEIDVAVSKGAKEARAGNAFADKDGAFEEKKWRKWLDKDHLDPVRKIQKEIARSHKESRFLPYRLTLTYLSEIANSVAWRAVDKSAKLYKEKGLEPDPADLKPEDLEITVRISSRRPPRGRYLRQQVERINKMLKIGEPEEPKADRPKKEGEGKKKKGAEEGSA